MNNKFNPKIHRRKSIRLSDYDYSSPRFYFITICTQHHECLFGKIIKDEMVFNAAGIMVNRIWLDIPKQHRNTRLHAHVIMPNHIHGIVEISVGAESISAHQTFMENNNREYIDKNNTNTANMNWANMEFAPTNTTALPEIVQTFKRRTTIEYVKMVKQYKLPKFDKKIWQRNYWEHVVRDEIGYKRITQYIIENPLNWDTNILNGGKESRLMGTTHK